MFGLRRSYTGLGRPYVGLVIAGLFRREHITPALESLGWDRFDGTLKERNVALLQDPARRRVALRTTGAC